MSQLSPSHIRAIAIQALATATLRRLALSVLFTIMTNSYQTTCTVSERTFNKRQHANARYRVESSLIEHYDMVAARTQPWRRNIAWMFHSANCWKKGRWGQSSQGSKTPLRTTSSTRARKGPRTGPAWGSAWLMQQDCAHHLRGRQPGKLHPRDHHSEYSRAKWH